MKYQKVFLLSPDYHHSQYGALHPPVGLGYLSEMLENRHIEYDVLDMRLNPSRKYLFSRIRRFKPDLLAVSLMTFLHKDNYELLRQIKSVFPDLTIAAGGPHISTFRENALRECPSIDFGITMEGEVSLFELCCQDDHAKVKGLIFRQSEEIKHSQDRDFVSDLDSLPFPRYEKFSLDRYVTDEIPILTSRGCPYQCIYCPVKTAIGRQVRMRSYGNIADEIEYWYRKGKRHFGIVDDNFAMNRERVIKLCLELKKKALDDLELRCPNGIRADHCDKELLIQMKSAGFKYLAFGVEAGNNKILSLLRKGETIENIKQAIQDACDLKFEVTLFFLVGSPGETMQDVEDSVKLALTYPVFDAKFYNLIPFPDTKLFEWVKENNLFIVKPQVYLNNASHWDSRPVFATPEFSYTERARALQYTANVRKRIRKTTMERKLNKLGILSFILAGIFVMDSIQTLLLHNSVLRRISQAIFRKFTK